MATNQVKRLSARKHLKILWYDKKYYAIPMPKNSYWFSDKDRGQNHCVVSCHNMSDVWYITDKGLVSIAYCMAHAEIKILHTMLTGNLERGLWCIIYNGKLQPHSYYKEFIDYLKKSNPKQAKALESKIRMWKDFLNIKGISRRKVLRLA